MDSIPTGGTFVAFTFDPVASAAHLDNIDLTAACTELALKQRKFVAFVQWATPDVSFPSNHYNPFRFHPIWQGLEHLPRPMLREGVQPNMLFPILPNTLHPTSCPEHKPVAPGQPLPWNDCYLSGLVRLEVRCETEWHDDDSVSAPYQATLEEAIRVDEQMASDGSEVYKRRIRTLPWPVPAEAASFSSDLSSVREDLQTTTKTDDEDAVLDERMMNLLIGYRELDDKFIVQCSTDLSTVDVINHPDELYEQLAEFERLKASLEVDRKCKEIEEARRIDDEHYANVPLPKPSRRYRLSLGLLLQLLGKRVKKVVPGRWLRKLDCRKKSDQESPSDS